MIPLIPGTPGFVEQLLADRIGLNVASVGEGLIQRCVADRMKQLGIRRLEDYERILLGTPDEVQALIEEVVIPESWFFRDDRPFATFREFVRAGWVDQPSLRPVSILCLPCASGEEPYSVAITLLELGLTPNRFQVVAVDISERSIRRAAVGMYTVNAFRGMDPRLQALYFISNQGKHLLKPAVRSAVRFEQGNILDSELLAEHPGFDVVFCRNLLIYFDEQARTKAFANLDRLTRMGGLLFLGHADRSNHSVQTRFAPYADSGSFVYRKQSSSTTSPPPVRSTSTPAAPSTQLPKRDQVIEPANSKANRLAQPVEPIQPRTSPSTNRHAVLDEVRTLADQGRYADAHRLISQFMGNNTLDASAHFLLGLIQQAIGNHTEAEAALAKAIYLDSEHDEALLALALLARRKGDMAAEAFYRRRAERVTLRKGRT